MTYFKGKDFNLSKVPFSNFFHIKNEKKIGTPQNKKNSFSKTVLYIFYLSKTTVHKAEQLFKKIVKITGPFGRYSQIGDTVLYVKIVAHRGTESGDTY